MIAKSRVVAGIALAALVCAIAVPASAGVVMSTGIRYVFEGNGASLDQCRTKAQTALQAYLQNATEKTPGSGEWQAYAKPNAQGQNTAAAIVDCTATPKGYVVTFTCAVQQPGNSFDADSLCLNIAQIQRVSDDAVTLECSSDPIILDLDVVTALGIVVAELLTNCYDHAFPAGRGAIHVSLKSDPNDDSVVILTIQDNGKGFTPVARSKRQGIGLVFRLIEQIRGTVVFESDHGTAWIIRFPAVDAAANGLTASTR